MENVKEGKEILAPNKYGSMRDFSEGLAVVLDYDYNKYGYIDKTGKEVIACKFDGATDFKGEIAYVKIGNKIYTINKNGELKEY